MTYIQPSIVTLVRRHRGQTIAVYHLQSWYSVHVCPFRPDALKSNTTSSTCELIRYTQRDSREGKFDQLWLAVGAAQHLSEKATQAVGGLREAEAMWRSSLSYPM